MWPSRDWWTGRGYKPADDHLTKELPNKWELCVSTSEPGIPNKPPVDGVTIYLVAYEPDGSTSTISFAMQRHTNIDPEKWLSALLKMAEELILV